MDWIGHGDEEKLSELIFSTYLQFTTNITNTNGDGTVYNGSVTALQTGQQGKVRILPNNFVKVTKS